MKLSSIFILILSTLFTISCKKEKDTVLFAIPNIKSLNEIRSNVAVMPAKATNANGKVYVTNKLLFYIAQELGVHIFDNQNPANPQNIAFLNLEGVHDIAVKGNYLYADNYVDLLVFDISNISNIRLVKTVENSISFFPSYPIDAAYYDYSIYPKQDEEIVVGYHLEKRKCPDYNSGIAFEGDATITANGISTTIGAITGTGGSYARFQINNNALYTVESYALKVFNISLPSQTFFDKPIYLNQWTGGGQFETLFKQGNYLFIGSTNGMYVVDASDEFNPEFISGFSHATSCDPVVVNGNTAFVTLRGGTNCNASIADQINVIDITDITHPILLSTYLMNQPLGLGVRNNTIYVCSGKGKGLNIFDASDLSSLTLKNTYADDVSDVIALDSHLIAVGKNKIIQYSYGDDFTLVPISTVNF